MVIVEVKQITLGKVNLNVYNGAMEEMVVLGMLVMPHISKVIELHIVSIFVLSVVFIDQENDDVVIADFIIKPVKI